MISTVKVPTMDLVRPIIQFQWRIAKRKTDCDICQSAIKKGYVVLTERLIDYEGDFDDKYRYCGECGRIRLKKEIVKERRRISKLADLIVCCQADCIAPLSPDRWKKVPTVKRKGSPIIHIQSHTDKYGIHSVCCREFQNGDMRVDVGKVSRVELKSGTPYCKQCVKMFKP